MDDAIVVRLDLPATYAQLNVLSSCIGALLERVDAIDDRERTVYAVQLAAHEVCTNIIDHAYLGAPEGRIAMTIQIIPQPRRMVVELEDRGNPCDPSLIGDPDLSRPHESGYGMFLVRNLVDTLDYTRTADGNRWTLTKHL